MRNTHTIAADLYSQGIRVVSVVGSVQREYLFAGSVSLATWDTDFTIKIEQSFQLVQSLIREYLSVMEYPIPRSRLY
jgi:hypothetical protein